MSTCAVMLVKDERDIIEWTVRHLLEQVDQVIVADNQSTDGTLEWLDQARRDFGGGNLMVRVDGEVGYYQDRKTTGLALEALALGHRWVLPCDADEFWYAPDGRTIGQFLDGLMPDVQIVRGTMYDHLASAHDDPAERSPFRRMGWRKREHNAGGKVCCRARPDLRIHMGNHDASTAGTALRVGGLVIRHYSFRSEEQYVRKIANGARAYAATDLPEQFGVGWRMFGMPPDDPAAYEEWSERLRGHFREWFWFDAPEEDDSMLYDPAPGA